MAGLFEDCREYFGTDDLYSVLNVTKEASDSVLKRAYHKVSLKVHPDRVSENEKDVATKKFQTLGKIYSILSNKETRAVYDETGEVDEEITTSKDRDWNEYWRILFKRVTVDDIKEFEAKYKGSEEETSDLISAYMDYEGDMEQILDSVMCCTPDDEDRFRKILNERIGKQEIPSYDSFTKESDKKKKTRQKKAAKEAQEAEEMKAKLNMGSGEDALRNAIMQRQAAREKEQNDFFAHLEAKYAPPKKKEKAQAKQKGKTKK